MDEDGHVILGPPQARRLTRLRAKAHQQLCSAEEATTTMFISVSGDMCIVTEPSSYQVAALYSFELKVLHQLRDYFFLSVICLSVCLSVCLYIYLEDTNA